MVIRPRLGTGWETTVDDSNQEVRLRFKLFGLPLPINEAGSLLTGGTCSCGVPGVVVEPGWRGVEWLGRHYLVWNGQS